MRRWIPNLLTLLNLLSGALAVTLILLGVVNDSLLNIAVVLMLLGALCDVFDGFVARKLGVASPLGLQLDSLADLITFGFAPSSLYFQMLSTAPFANEMQGYYRILLFSPFLLLLFSAYRLAKFNVDTEQHYYFKGLATPASALFTMGLALAIINETASPLVLFLQRTPFAIPVLVLLQGLLLVSNIPMFSLKFRDFAWRKLLPHFLFVGVLVVGLIFLRWEGLSLAIIAYIVISLIFRKQIVNG